ncbi:glycosyltransferase [Parvibaculum sp.]|uniref:glycosyltransferase n=1 Tax=Parvibaculum sp. TaxID=2024848 RepID=UPI002CD67EB2|nr:glycosyltransferase [Parvibaculum sp.]HUD50176.1 glycosyltransferase [Parvibaculum sp.]
MKRRVLYVVHEFPQISQTYILNEIIALEQDYDIRVVALEEPDIPIETDHKAYVTKRFNRIVEIAQEFRPDVLHSHYVLHGPLMLKLSRRLGVPFTIRGHSFDVLSPPSRYSFFKRIRRKLRGKPEFWVSYKEHASTTFNSPHCLGVLLFPFQRPLLEAAGVRTSKIHDCFPVMDFDLFHDRSPNGDAIMNVGACIPKKKMTDFVDLAASMPDRRFNLYALGYYVDDIRNYNEAASNPVTIVPPVQPRNMPAEYKKHRWMVYTGDHVLKSLGWPLALAEAQASGVGVCVANVRPDLREFIGNAGFVFDSVEDVRKIVSQPFSDELRERGFEQAKKSDIRIHKTVLTDLWQKSFRSAPSPNS